VCPEKRDFFMEGEQFFGFGTQSGAPGNDPEIPVIFFSRRIGLENGGVVPIVGGGRLLGRSGRNRFVWNADHAGIDIKHMFAGGDFNPEVGFARRPEGFQNLHGRFRYSRRRHNIPGSSRAASPSGRSGG
jgi:hypothetical protein